MTRANRSWKFWLLSAGCVGVVVWLAYGSLQAADTDRKPIVLDRAPLRVIKDPYPSLIRTGKGKTWGHPSDHQTLRAAPFMFFVHGLQKVSDWKRMAAVVPATVVSLSTLTVP